MTDPSPETPPETLAERPAKTPAAPKRRGAAAARQTPGAVKYDARFCAEVVEFMGKGYSLTAFAGEIGATRAELIVWSKRYATFAKAVQRAQARRARLLEDRLLAARGANAFGAHMQALKTAAPDEWPEGSTAFRRSHSQPVRNPSGSPAKINLPDNKRGQ